MEDWLTSNNLSNVKTIGFNPFCNSIPENLKIEEINKMENEWIDDDDYELPDDIAEGSMCCDLYGYCCGSSCKNYYNCQGEW